jgi:predicted hydrolase (HD superfamily)
MIPTEDQAKHLWIKYKVPESKRRHLELVGKVSSYIAQRLLIHDSRFTINPKLLVAAALLHDIDKAVPKLPGERHPDAAVRILREEGMPEVADLVVSHPLHLIIDPVTAPKTWEEKILFLSDKMVKYDIITVDARFKLWNDEHLPPDEQRILDRSYPKVKILEAEIFSLSGLSAKFIRDECSGSS